MQQEASSCTCVTAASPHLPSSSSMQDQHVGGVRELFPPLHQGLPFGSCAHATIISSSPFLPCYGLGVASFQLVGSCAWAGLLQTVSILPCFPFLLPILHNAGAASSRVVEAVVTVRIRFADTCPRTAPHRPVAVSHRSQRSRRLQEAAARVQAQHPSA